MNKYPPLPYQLAKDKCLKQGKFFMNYEELLWTQEWIYFRNEIRYRDKETCTKCSLSQYKEMSNEEFVKVLASSGYNKYYDLYEGKFVDEPNEFTLKKNTDYPSKFKYDEKVKLEIHHKYYIWGKLPWEYNCNALTTLCDSCHEKEHFENNRIVYSTDSLTTKKNLKDCSKCNGIGYINAYRHVQNGICFNCWGFGGVLEESEKNLFDISNQSLDFKQKTQSNSLIIDLQNRLSELNELSKETSAAMLEVPLNDTDNYDILERGLNSINIEIVDICNDLRAYGIS